MIKFIRAAAAIMLMTIVVITMSCRKVTSSGVVLTTYAPQDITDTTAVCGCEVTVEQGIELTEIGVCWSENQNPTVADSHISTWDCDEPFTTTITGLKPNTKYHVRAYALRGSDYFYYGMNKTFYTLLNGGSGGTTPPINNHDWVDLGLPSGTLWATCNVGANSPEEYGDYFAWGETQPQADNSYNSSSYKYVNGTNGKLTKYCNDVNLGDNGFTDNLTVLLPEDDAATANWGNNWRMPTQAELKELKDNCTMTWTTQNGVNGSLFTASNGKSIFLPAAGGHWECSFEHAGIAGKYWSASLNTGASNIALGLFFSSDFDFCSVANSFRHYGFSVRPVWAY